ncbi:MAG: hypothetical protein B7Z82_00830 [Halothiobacillus sp. 20-54-6]|nr:MAG: hypothetical protein B7Z82_00830 [Halothiobacillus sp. 20-54-6]
MFDVLRQFALLLLLRVGPQDMPVGWRMTTWAALWFVLCGLILGFVNQDELADWVNTAGQGVLDNVLDMALIGAYSGSWVFFRQRSARLAQLLTALLGALGMLGLVLALMWLVVPMPTTLPDTMGVSEWLMMGLFIWNLVVVGQIYRRTLEVGVGLGIFIALGYYIISALVVLLANSLF